MPESAWITVPVEPTFTRMQRYLSTSPTRFTFKKTEHDVLSNGLIESNNATVSYLGTRILMQKATNSNIFHFAPGIASTLAAYALTTGHPSLRAFTCIASSLFRPGKTKDGYIRFTPVHCVVSVLVALFTYLLTTPECTEDDDCTKSLLNGLSHAALMVPLLIDVWIYESNDYSLSHIIAVRKAEEQLLSRLRID